jgi:hypothetical protein
VTKTGEVVLCIVCNQWHEEHPDPREGDNRPHAQDYTYYKDNYKGVYGVICTEHDRDSISEKKAEDFDTDYKNNGLSL